MAAPAYRPGTRPRPTTPTVVGDPFPFGIEANRKALETMTQFAVDQTMVPRRFTVEELFAVELTDV